MIVCRYLESSRKWMGAWFCLAITLACIACKTRPEPPPPDVAESDLKLFLDGMLVTTTTPPVYDSIWQVNQPRQLDWIDYATRSTFGINTVDELRAHLDVSVDKMTRLDASYHVSHFKDYLTALKIWKRFLHEDPDDLDAALRAANLSMVLESPKAALDLIARSSGKTARAKSSHARQIAGRLEGMRCFLLLLRGRNDEALQACDLAIELGDFYSSASLVDVLLALGKNKEALVQAQQVAKSPRGARDPQAALTLGVAQQANGLDQDARATWNLAFAKWPRMAFFRKAVTGPRRSPSQWAENPLSEWAMEVGGDLALCGHHYSELGMEARAQECYRRSERLVAGPALAHQLVFLGQTKPQEALARAIEAATANPHPDLISAVGWLYLHQNRFDEARKWIQRGLDVDPYHAKSMSLMWQVCGKQDDYLCVIDFRKRLGLPTHFNRKEYEDANRAWRDQARRNGVHLPARELDSASAVKPPPVSAIVIIPLGDRVPPELAGMTGFLSPRFPGLKITVGPLEEVPKGAFSNGRRQILWEDLLDRLREEPGRIYVVEHDLGLYDANFAYALFDLAHGRAVISLSRLRSLIGDSTATATDLDEPLLRAATHRLRSQTLAAAAKLVGMSFPCSKSACSMRERLSVLDFALNEPALCDVHQRELNAILQARR